MKLKIQKPCTEDWDKMSPNQIGKHCDKCDKSIVDLSHSTDLEILNFFKTKKETICGRLTKFQLNHDFYEAPKVNSNAFGRYVAASFTLLALTPSLVAQNNDLNVRTPIVAVRNINAINLESSFQNKKEVEISLQNQEGTLLAHASVRIVGGTENYTADSLGVVRFDIPEKFKGKEMTLIVESSRFREGEFVIDANKTPIISAITVEMYELYLLGDIGPYEDEEIFPKKKECKIKK